MLRNKEFDTEERERVKGYNCATVPSYIQDGAIAQLQKNLQFLDFTSLAAGLFLCLDTKFPLYFPFTIANGNPLSTIG